MHWLLYVVDCRFDLVAVAPTVFVVLHIIVEDKKVGAADLVEVAAPGDVRRLQDDNVHFSMVRAMV